MMKAATQMSKREEYTLYVIWSVFLALGIAFLLAERTWLTIGFNFAATITGIIFVRRQRMLTKGEAPNDNG